MPDEKVNMLPADVIKSTNPNSNDGAGQIVPSGQFASAHLNESHLYNLNIEHSTHVQVNIRDPKLPDVSALPKTTKQKSAIVTPTRDDQKNTQTPVPVTCDPLKGLCSGTKQQTAYLDKCYKDAFTKKKLQSLKISDTKFFTNLFKNPAKNTPDQFKMLREDYALVMFMVHTVVLI